MVLVHVTIKAEHVVIKLLMVLLVIIIMDTVVVEVAIGVDVEEPGKEEHQIVSEPSTKSVYSNITSVETVHQLETVVMVDMDRVHQT